MELKNSQFMNTSQLEMILFSLLQLIEFLWNWMLLVGVYPVRPKVPAVGGYEGVGEVYSVGSAVKGLAPGDWVIPSPPSSGRFSFSSSANLFHTSCLMSVAD